MSIYVLITKVAAEFQMDITEIVGEFSMYFILVFMLKRVEKFMKLWSA